MINYVLGKFFDANKKSKLTILKNRETCFNDVNFNRKLQLREVEETCLSSCFSKIKGLNVEERLRANQLI